MGNSNGKEARPPPSLVNPNSPEALRQSAAAEDNVYGSRQGRASQSNLANLFGSSSNREREREREGPQDEAALAARRETKAEREARRLEKEKLARERERERSMREESVDGGYLVTQGVYTGVEDYNKSIVRSLMIDRRIAPFWPGLNDHDSSWTDHQLLAAVHGRPVPRADEPPAHIPHWHPADGPRFLDGPSASNASQSTLAGLSAPQISSSPPLASGLLKGRTKGIASLTVPSSSRGASSTDLTQREITLPVEPNVGEQRLELYLYKDASECPICFLSYPPYLNRTRCCDQPICSECFVQIRRPDPHPPEHHDDPNNPTAQVQMSQEREQDAGEVRLVSEPAQCPYCAQPEFGITYEPPPIRRGLVYANSASSSPSPLPSPTSPTPHGSRKRAASLPATASTVVTTDKVRPEWSSKLATARAHAARRSAAATALHTAAYMMGGGRERRSIFRRGLSSRGVLGIDEDAEGSNGAGGGASSLAAYQQLDIISMMQAAARGPPGGQSPAGQRGSSRRNRAEDIEEMMMLEAIRLSLVAEEERQKKEEKERAREAKKQAKEEKKAQKEAQKASRKGSGSSSNLYGLLGASRSNLTVNSAQPSMVSQDSANTQSGKGKGLLRERSNSNTYAPSPSASSLDPGAQAHLERSRANLQPPDSSAGAARPSHLRTLSNASSSTSSLNDLAPNPSGLNIPRAGASTEHVDMSVTPPGGGAGLEPMLNYRSLMAMMEEEERGKAGEGSATRTRDDSPATGSSSFGQDALQGIERVGIDDDEKADNAAQQPSHHETTNHATKHSINVTSGPMSHDQVS